MAIAADEEPVGYGTGVRTLEEGLDVVLLPSGSGDADDEALIPWDGGVVAYAEGGR